MKIEIFSIRSLEQYRKFYLSYNEITQALLAQSFQSLFQTLANGTVVDCFKGQPNPDKYNSGNS